jgi:uncharacterized DUF497 family protein
VRIVWDEEKNRRNLAKHGVSFERAQLVFQDPRIHTVSDPCEHEERWRAMGLVNGAVILLVAYTTSESDDADEEEIRIISARKATPLEREAYDDPH